MHDKYRRQRRSKGAEPRLRRKIATEAARILLKQIEGEPSDAAAVVPESYLATAKRQAVSLLGQRVRESDLPTDAEVREQIVALARSKAVLDVHSESANQLARMADHVDRFAIYRLRLEPLQSIKLNPKSHPEGDALYHSLQVFERARDARPYDEEFLLAALLHHVGRAIESDDPVAAGLQALAGTLTERAAWLIEHLPEVLPRPNRPVPQRLLQGLASHEHYEDLELLRDIDLAARVPGAPVGTVDEALDYLRSLESFDDASTASECGPSPGA